MPIRKNIGTSDASKNHRRFQQKQKNVKGRGAFFDRVPGRNDGDRHHKRRQNDQPERKPVNADMVIGVDRLDPRYVLLE
jgi:hypothetical protein